MNDTLTMDAGVDCAVAPKTKAKRRDPITWIVKPAVWALCLAPLAWLGWLVADAFFFGGRIFKCPGSLTFGYGPKLVHQWAGSGLGV